jgi:2-polyprenyl-6-methoxyphenol hydroxylase-like FAD-dependent oxidoreductase
MKALTILGVADAVRSVSLPTAGIAMRAWRGEWLFDVMPSDRLEAASDLSGAAMRRSDLLDALLEALGKDTVRFGARCVGYTQDGGRVTAYFDDGSQACGSVLVGADGIRSSIRAQMLGKTKLRYAGYAVWRGVARFKLDRNVGVTTMGRGAQFGFFPMRQDRVYWFASMNAPEGEQDSPAGPRPRLLECFGNWHEPIKEIIEATDQSSIIRTDIYDQDPLSRWSDGRVTLLGDAAHPATPTMGQGACQAIEDAVVLAACLGANPNAAQALKAYEGRRMKRTGAITMQSRRMGEMGRWKNPLACWLRDRLIKNIPNRARLRQLGEMFRFDV